MQSAYFSHTHINFKVNSLLVQELQNRNFPEVCKLSNNDRVDALIFRSMFIRSIWFLKKILWFVGFAFCLRLHFILEFRECLWAHVTDDVSWRHQQQNCRHIGNHVIQKRNVHYTWIQFIPRLFNQCEIIKKWKFS